MSLSELLNLPVAFDLDTSNRALSLGRTKGFELARTGNYPVPLIRIGHSYRVSRAALLDLLGVPPQLAHTPANSEAVAGATATASSEQPTQTA